MKRQLLGQDQTVIQITTWIVNHLLLRQLLPEKKHNNNTANTKHVAKLWIWQHKVEWVEVIMGVARGNIQQHSPDRTAFTLGLMLLRLENGNYYKCKAGNEMNLFTFPSLSSSSHLTHYPPPPLLPPLLPPISPTSLPMSSPSQDPHQRKTNDLWAATSSNFRFMIWGRRATRF